MEIKIEKVGTVTISEEECERLRILVNSSITRITTKMEKSRKALPQDLDLIRTGKGFIALMNLVIDGDPSET